MSTTAATVDVTEVVNKADIKETEQQLDALEGLGLSETQMAEIHRVGKEAFDKHLGDKSPFDGMKQQVAVAVQDMRDELINGMDDDTDNYSRGEVESFIDEAVKGTLVAVDQGCGLTGGDLSFADAYFELINT